jgi:hypothetical protein
VGFAGYVSICVLVYCMLVFHCISLHVSAYMAIFMCVGVIVCWFPLSFTTYFGLHGHLQVCSSYCMLVSTVFHYMATFKCVAVIVCSFSLSFTTCFGLHGHLQWRGSYSVGFHCLSLHVSAYMAIFKCVGVIVCWFPLPFTTWPSSSV